MQMAEDGDEAISLICKLCGLLVMVPGNFAPFFRFSGLMTAYGLVM